MFDYSELTLLHKPDLLARPYTFAHGTTFKELNRRTGPHAMKKMAAPPAMLCASRSRLACQWPGCACKPGAG